MLSQYPNRTYVESGNSRDSTPKPKPKTPPPLPTNCALDIVIGLDIMIGVGCNSFAPPNNHCGIWEGENDFVRELITGLDTHMNGSIGGVAGSGTSDIQVGTYVWGNDYSATCDSYNTVVRYMTDDSQLIVDDANIVITNPPPPNWMSSNPAVLGHRVGWGAPNMGCGRSFLTAAQMGMDILNFTANSALASQYPARQNQPNYRRIMIIVTDAQMPYGMLGVTGSPAQQAVSLIAGPQWVPISNTCWNTAAYGNLGGAHSLDWMNVVWNFGTNQGAPELDVEVYALMLTKPYPNAVPPLTSSLPGPWYTGGSYSAHPVTGILGACPTCWEPLLSCLAENPVFPPTFPGGGIDHGDGAVKGIEYSNYFSNMICPGTSTLCTDPTNPWSQMPYAYRTSWWHDPNDPNMVYTNQITLPGPWALPTQNQPPNPSPWGPSIAPYTNIDSSYQSTQTNSLNMLIQGQNFGGIPTASLGPWLDTSVVPNVTHPSHVRMENQTANMDYANQSSICEWCADWIDGIPTGTWSTGLGVFTPGGINPTGTGSLPGAFNPQVLNWPMFIANGWGLSEAEAMCDCCPAIDPGITAWPFPPQNGAVIAEWTGYH